MSSTAPTDLTALLRAWSAGDADAADRLVAVVYKELRRQATRYLSRERADGETLRARLDRGPFPVDEALRVAQQILSGLRPRGKGIIHRDLKPENLFIMSDGIVKILDFGLAKHAVPAAGPASDVTDRCLIVGTAGYMAPEQVRGEQADVRSDLFSFGAVLYEMVTGVRAFSGPSAVETMHAVLTMDPPLTNSLPAGVGAVVKRCLAKEVTRRFDSARDAAAALISITPAGTQPPRLPRSLTYRAAVALLAIGAIAAAMLLALGADAPPRPGATGRPALAVLPVEDRTDDPAAGWLSTGVPSVESGLRLDVQLLLAAAELAGRVGERSIRGTERARYLQVWKGD